YALPEPIADHDHRWRADFIFVCTERATDFGWQTDHVEKIPSDRSARDALGFAAGNATEVTRFLMSAREMFECFVVVSPVEIIRQRDREILPRSRRFV